MLLPSALGSSPFPPVSVYGTGPYTTIVAFLGRQLALFATLFRSASRISALAPGSFPGSRTAARVPTPSVYKGHRIINLLSITYASPPRLRSRLSQGRSALPWKPLVFGLDDSHIHLATHSGILSSWISTAPYRYGFYAPSMLPYQSHAPAGTCDSTASVACFSPVYFRRRTSRPVSYYALFECVAASEPTSWLSMKSHILFHLTRS